jgi:hypothetical protein
MGTSGDSYTRTVTSNHSDGNIYAGAATLRHSWNPDNTLAQWQQRFGEDRNSRQMPVTFELPATGFKLLSRDGLDTATALPGQLAWKPSQPGRVGSSRMQWP